ncbi:MAG: UvrD-helicase domain-containing protein [Bacilli bacterium]|nr:UvrD-helicase domain-containing protein [Bacilli bacterium]
MNKFDLNNFNPNLNYVIEASAGTGKTYNIVEIVDKYVNVYNFELNEILIVTYTEKAAGELKDRIRDKLKNKNVDNASIYTIHSFCQNAIKEFGLSANLPFNLNVVDESEMYKFVERYVRDSDIIKDITMFVETQESFDIDSLKEILVKGCQMYYLDINNNEDKSIITLNESTTYEDIYNYKKSLATSKTFEDILSKNDRIAYNYNILKNGIFDKSKDLASILSTVEHFNFNGNSFRKKKFEEASIDEYNAYLYFYNLKDNIKKIKNEKLIASIYLKDFYIKWQYEKELNKNQTFDDMIRYVRESIIHDDKLKNKLKNKYKRAIIDEFQDTNQRQFDIFKNIFMEDDEHKIIVVGDPKQSIYSFQGADINVYYNAKEAIKNNNGEICMLNKNYRSTEDMVDSCNKLFNYYDFSGTTFEDCGSLSKNNDNEYHEVKYCGKDTNAFWIATDEFDNSIDENDFSKIAVEQIIDCCTFDSDGKTKLQVKDKSGEFRNVSFKDFAVLARTKSEMFAIEKALKNAGVPYLRYKDKQLFLGKECAHWICLLKAINVEDFTGRNRKLLKKALFTNFFSLSLEQINSDYVNKDDIKEIEIINNWKYLAYTNKWEDLFDDIIISSKISDKLKSLKDIQSLSIYKQIANYCIDYLSKAKTLKELINNLTNLSKNGDFEGDDQNGNIIEKSTNFDCVQIMTIHASKGLQFPVVIAVGGFKESFKNAKAYKCHKKDENNNDQQILVFDRSNDVAEEETAEWKRLFYVAYTRPQFLLILPLYKIYGDRFLETSIKDYMNNHKDSYKIVHSNKESYTKLRSKTSEILSKYNKVSNDQYEKIAQDQILKDLIKENYHKKIQKHSYSSLSHENKQQDDYEINKEGLIEEGLSMFDKLAKPVNLNYDKEKEPIELSIDYPKGAKIGTALHEILAETDFEQYDRNIENRIKNCFIKQGIKTIEEWINDTKQIVENVVNANLPVINGSQIKNETLNLKSITLDSKLDEVEFNFNILTEDFRNYCNGFVDLIFKNNEYYAIVDWKSDRLYDTFDSYSSLDSIKRHVDDAYSIQRVLYSYCLIKWLKLHNKDLSEQEIFEKHFGGVYYIFIRGCNYNTFNGVYAQTWESWNDLEQSFKQIIQVKIGGMINE